MSSVVSPVPSHIHSDLPSSVASSRVSFNTWLKNASVGSMYLDAAERLYIKTVFGHERIENPAISWAVIHRERLIIQAIKRNRRVIRVLVVSTLFLSLALIALAALKK